MSLEDRWMTRALCRVAAAWMATRGAQGWCNSVVNDGWRRLLAGELAVAMMVWSGVGTWGVGVRGYRYGDAP